MCDLRRLNFHKNILLVLLLKFSRNANLLVVKVQSALQQTEKNCHCCAVVQCHSFLFFCSYFFSNHLQVNKPKTKQVKMMVSCTALAPKENSIPPISIIIMIIITTAMSM